MGWKHTNVQTLVKENEVMGGCLIEDLLQWWSMLSSSSMHERKSRRICDALARRCREASVAILDRQHKGRWSGGRRPIGNHWKKVYQGRLTRDYIKDTKGAKAGAEGNRRVPTGVWELMNPSEGVEGSHTRNSIAKCKMDAHWKGGATLWATSGLWQFERPPYNSRFGRTIPGNH